MKFSINALIQALSIAAHVGNVSGAMVPPKYQVPTALGVGVIQSVTAFLAHFRNPDGTLATTPYVPPRGN